MSSKNNKQKITKDMLLGDVFEKHGMKAAKAMMERGLHCLGCHISAFETIEQGASAHGMDKKEVEALVKELNTIVNKKGKAK